MKKLLASALALLLLAQPALAQDVPAHAVPIGEGPGVIGWGIGGPCATNQALLWTGGTLSDPTCSALTIGVLSGLPLPASAIGPIPLSQLSGWPIPVLSGGTGLTTLTQNGILIGEGIAALSAIAPSVAGRFLIDQGAGSMPAFFTITGTIACTLSGVCTVGNGGITNALLSNMAANTVKGAIATGAPTDLPVPSCSLSNSSAQWISGVGWGCETHVANLNVSDQTLSGGANVTSLNLGNFSSGTLQIDCGKNPLQYLSDSGAFTISSPTADGSCIVLVKMISSASTITFPLSASGGSNGQWAVGSNTGDTLAYTFGSMFSIQIWRIAGVSRYEIAAHQ